MIFIQFRLEEENKARIFYQHMMPLDSIHGIRKPDKTLYTTQEELLQDFPNSLFLDAVPDPQELEGKVTTGLFINPQTRQLWYEYENAPPESINPEEEIAKLKANIDYLSIMAGVDLSV